MPKPKIVEFVVCDVCGCKFLNKDLDTHLGSESTCAGSAPLHVNSVGDLQITWRHFKHSTSRGDVFLGKIHKSTSNEVSACLSPGHRAVFLHPALMRSCHFWFGKPVVVNRQMVLWVYPDSGVSIDCVGLSSDSLKFVQSLTPCNDDAVVVEKLTSPTLPARTMVCCVNSGGNFQEDEHFTNFVKKFCVGQFVCVNREITFDYYGLECVLRVDQVSGADSNLHGGGRSADGYRSGADNVQMEGQTIGSLERISKRDELCDEFGAKCSVTSDVCLPHKLFFCVTNDTFIVITFDSMKDNNDSVPLQSPWQPFGGYRQQMSLLRQAIRDHLDPSQRFQMQNLEVSRSVLIFGPSGSGKTTLCHSLAAEFLVKSVVIRGSDIWSRFLGETESTLKKLFNKAKKIAPSLLILDEVEMLCPRRESCRSALNRRVSATLLTLLDEMKSEDRVFVMATTNDRFGLDAALCRPGRLDFEVEIGVPTPSDRLEILKSLVPNLASSYIEDLTVVAEKTHGYLGSDLAAVYKQASLRAVQKLSKDSVCVSLDDLMYGVQTVKPSALKEVSLQISKVCWSDIGGQEELKHKLRQAVEWPLKHREAFQRLGIRPPRGLLMYGPPGCSKTMIAKALAKESGLNFIGIKGPELFSKWVGESERAIRQLFARAKSAAPAIIFFDEIDALASARNGESGGGGDVANRVLAQLLTEMDGVESLGDILVVAATNRPDMIDKALLRPGRLDRLIYVPLPDNATREAIFKIQFRKMPVSEDVDMHQLVDSTQGYSGAEVSAVCHEAALFAMQDDLEAERVEWKHLQQALSVVTPRVTPQLLAIYDNYHRQKGAV